MGLISAIRSLISQATNFFLNLSKNLNPKPGKNMATINGVVGAQYTQGQPGYIDRKYQYATSTYGEEHHMQPALIVYPTSKQDISKAIQYARSEGIAIAVRTGGHQYSGASSTLAPNIQLDLKTTFRAEEDRQIFEKNGETFVRTGVSWPLGAFNEFLGNNGLFIPHGQCTNVHLGGHVQTGGYGQLGRSFGLFGDHVVGLEIVDWQGNIKEVTLQSDPELFGAFLGGSPGNFGVITHIVLKVHRDQDYVGSIGLKALYWYDPDTLERLLNNIAEMSDDPNFPRNYDLCVSVLSSSNELLDWFPEVDLKMQREHPELYGKDGNPFWPRVIICYAQWVPFSKDDVPDEGWFENIKKGCLFPFTTNAEVKPMSQLTKQWIFTNVREFDKPYVKSTLFSDSTDLVKRGWAKWCTQRVDAIVKPEANRCWMSAQFQPYGGKNSMFTKNAENGTSYSWRNNSTVCATMDVFYGAGHQTTAEDWHTVTVQQAVGENGKFSSQERRVLWGSFGEFDLNKVWNLYYESQEKYEKLKNARSKADPEGVFTPNTFAVARK